MGFVDIGYINGQSVISECPCNNAGAGYNQISEGFWILSIEATGKWQTLYKTLQVIKPKDMIVIASLFRIRATMEPIGSLNPSIIRASLEVVNGASWYRVWPPQPVVRTKKTQLLAIANGYDSEGFDSEHLAVEDC